MGNIKVFAPFKIEEEQIKAMEHLMNQVLADGQLQYFRNHTGSKSAFFRFILDIGITQLGKDFAKWKKIKEDEI